MSATIYRFPRSSRRRPIPLLPPPRPIRYRGSLGHGYDFSVLLAATLVAVFFYLSRAVEVARHDRLYTALLAVLWSFYFLHPPLLRVRVLGSLLIRAGRLLLLAGVAGFFGFVYWLVLTHP